MNDLSLLWLPNYKQLCVNFAFGKLPTACLTLSSSAMAFSCSFQKITGTDCSFDRLDKSRSLEIVALRNCSKDISNHYSHWSFSGVTTESDLILARVGIFREEETQGLDTICPHQRRELGLGWRRPFQQEFQVGESELCQQPLLRPERWRAYDIGPGKSIPWTKFDVPEQSELPTMEIRPSISETITSFVPVRPRRTGGRAPLEGNSDCEDQSSDESSAHVDAANNCRLFTC